MKHALLNTYKRSDIIFVSGEGAKLTDENGKEYIDFLAGLAVVSVGHTHPRVTKAIQEQAARLVHVSNLFWTKPAMELSLKLREVSGGDFLSFFCNSGTEATECALKFARKATGEQRSKIVCAHGSFHGRTYAALAATGQPAKWQGFSPMPSGYVHAPFNDLEAFDQLIGEDTAAVMLELIQGEGGVIPAEPGFIKGISQLCRERGALLMFDEVQTGCGRTGMFWAWQHYGVKPDVFVTAKGLGNGMPIGVCLVHDSLAAHYSPGDHGSTFGGGPVQVSAALATLETIESESLVSLAHDRGAFLAQQLEKVDGIESVRGMGLMRAAKFSFECAKQVTERLLELGVVVNNVCPDAIRITPPLCISEEEVSEGVRRIAQAVSEFQSKDRGTE